LDEISSCQVLSESFIREFKNVLNWKKVSSRQQLSEDFIREFQDKVNWYDIPYFQPWINFSEEFKKDFKDKLIYPENHIQPTDKEKLEQIKAYAKKHKLEFDGEYLYAFRNHDTWGRGAFNKTIFYTKGETYRDWHCDMNPNHENSFGLGIFPKGNTKVKVNYQDWGVEVNRSDGKSRVLAFEII
jgi:hypothetical protein